MDEKKSVKYGYPNEKLDFFLGFLSWLGLVIQLFRKGKTEVAWWWFVGGWLTSWVLGLVVSAVVLGGNNGS